MLIERGILSMLALDSTDAGSGRVLAVRWPHKPGYEPNTGWDKGYYDKILRFKILPKFESILKQNIWRIPWDTLSQNISPDSSWFFLWCLILPDPFWPPSIDLPLSDLTKWFCPLHLVCVKSVIHSRIYYTGATSLTLKLGSQTQLDSSSYCKAAAKSVIFAFVLPATIQGTLMWITALRV